MRYSKSQLEVHARVRQRLKWEARELGLSTKRYRALSCPSVGWSHAVSTIRLRCKKSGVVCQLTPDGLRRLWDKQRGVCPLTGWKMEPRKTGSGLIPRTVTVDRIDPKRGYVRGNIRLISFAANNAKYIWTDAALYNFCKAVTSENFY